MIFPSVLENFSGRWHGLNFELPNQTLLRPGSGAPGGASALNSLERVLATRISIAAVSFVLVLYPEDIKWVSWPFFCGEAKHGSTPRKWPKLCFSQSTVLSLRLELEGYSCSTGNNHQFPKTKVNEVRTHNAEARTRHEASISKYFRSGKVKAGSKK